MPTTLREIIEQNYRGAGFRSENELALSLGITRQTLSNWKTRGSGDEEMMIRLAEKLRLPVEVVLTAAGKRVETSEVSASAMNVARMLDEMSPDYRETAESLVLEVLRLFQKQHRPLEEEPLLHANVGEKPEKNKPVG